MNKKILCILVCMLMLAIIPTAAGMQRDNEKEKSDGIFDRTYVQGFILGSQTEGIYTTFFALRVKYTTYNLFGQADCGVLILHRVTFPGRLNGYIGQFYISGQFWGSIE